MAAARMLDARLRLKDTALARQVRERARGAVAHEIDTELNAITLWRVGRSAQPDDLA